MSRIHTRDSPVGHAADEPSSPVKNVSDFVERNTRREILLPELFEFMVNL